ncbi:acyl-CoA dehydrogenase family protein [Actinocorallia sp. A-T 12471]|uniref:acyl-CoA dehydrogenase family protein n=1 Tax=Actinocorallia sp. A-T 12471 TaxID=3089813 RepID=UPI0029CC6594|nr:acyl-CoA dehydrogenase family protein [Actinocorallia sp. A-T 12471]MDX6741633.1 acyl-CoA dehydrogenase family protein [Actinocorallia sp. A-T 12471]
MTVTHTPPGTGLDPVAAAAGLVPLLKEHAAATADARRLPEPVVTALTEAGLFALRKPARYGGAEASARTVVDTVAELARGDGSAAWVVGVNAITMWMAGLLPDPVQDEVFASPDVRLCGTLSPSGMCAPADGGYVLDGRWGFISGALHADWQIIVALAPTPDGASFWPVLTVVPLSELTVVDDWDAFGLRGTGSVSTVAEGVFVPAARVLPLPLVLAEQYASEANAASPVWQAPLLPTASALSVGVASGLARAAREAFLDRLPGRKITYTSYESQAEAPVTHLRLAEATHLADESLFHAHRVAALVDGKAGAPWTAEERAAARASLGRACELAKRSADAFAEAGGGSSVYRDVPLQRIAADAAAIGLHALMHPATNAELYGRVLCGLEPNTLYF